MGQVRDLKGCTVGRLTVVERGPDFETASGDVRVQWWCHCSICDDEYLIVARDLRRGKWDKGCNQCKKTFRMVERTNQTLQ